MSEIILQVENLKQYFPISRHNTVKAVDGISFSIRKGEIFGLVGESGCGKSTVARCVMGLYRPTGGSISFKGKEITNPAVYRENKEDIHRNMQIIFQDSAAALNPRMTVKQIIEEPLDANKNRQHSEERRNRLEELLAQVGMDMSYVSKRPGELSGGQRQRIAIARALSTNPELIVADEPIASLDLSIQAQILNLFRQTQKEQKFSFLFIAHDLSVIRYLCDEVGVMLQGKLVERAQTEELFSNPLHPYTKALLSAVPIPDPISERSKKILDYNVAEFHKEGIWKEAGHNHWVLE